MPPPTVVSVYCLTTVRAAAIVSMFNQVALSIETSTTRLAVPPLATEMIAIDLEHCLRSRTIWFVVLAALS